MSSSSGPLLSVVRDSVFTNPKDAHLNVFNYLKQGGTKDEDLELFRKCWSKTHASNQVFGRSGPSDPSLFAKELIDELNKHIHCIDKLDKIEKLILKWHKIGSNQSERVGKIDNDKAVESIKNIYLIDKELQISANKSSQIDNILEPCYDDNNDEIELGHEEAQIALKRALKGTKLDWKSKDKYSIFSGHADGFIPLRMDTIGHPELMFGSIRLRSGAESGMQATTLIGMRIKPDQVTHTSRAWDAYHTLCGCVSAKNLNCFSVPLSVKVDKSGVTIFAFEYPERARSMNSLIGSNIGKSPRFNIKYKPGALATFLRKYPLVLVTWAMQLGSCYRALVKSENISNFAVPLDVSSSAWVRDNGMLVLGNAVYVCKDQDLKNDSIYDNNYVKFKQNILTQVLCLSRDIKVNMIDHRLLSDDDNVDNNEENDENKEEISKEKIQKIGEGRFAYALALGSEMIINIDNFKLKDINVQSIFEDEYGRRRNKKDDEKVDIKTDELNVSVIGRNDIVVVDVLYPPKGIITFDKNNLMDNIKFKIKALDVGTITLSLRMEHRDMMGNVKILGAEISITIIAAVPISQTDCSELVDLLEMSYKMKEPVFLRAQAFRKKKYDEVETSSAWDKIMGALKEHKM